MKYAIIYLEHESFQRRLYLTDCSLLIISLSTTLACSLIDPEGSLYYYTRAFQSSILFNISRQHGVHECIRDMAATGRR